MNPPASSSRKIRTGLFEIDLASGQMHKNGRRVPLQEQPFRVLAMLLERPGEVVTRQELQARLWPADTFVGFDEGLNTAIRKLRTAFGDSSANPRFIETLPRRGYRFIGPRSDELARLPDGDSTSLIAVPGDEVSVQLDSRDRLPTVPNEQAAPAVEHYADPGRSNPVHSRFLIWITAAVVLGITVGTILRSKNYAPARKRMFVVLPFENLTGDPAQEYIADGMTEEMITQMGGLDPERIGVIARTSAMRFKGTQKGVAEIARELGVGYLLEGSVRHVGDRVRVTAQLIQASDQTHLWAADYDSDLSDLLQLERDIADAIASQVQARLNPGFEKRFARPTRPEAQAAYLRGLEDWNLRTPSSIADSVSEFQRAIAADPNYALAYAALARCYAIGPIFGVGNPIETMPRARELSLRALELNPDLAEAHSILAMVAAHYDYDWATAEREFLTALRLNPSDPYAHLFYSNSFLSPRGRHKAAIEEMQKAIALDPFSIPLQAFLIRSYTWARRYDDARSQFKETNEVAPNFALLHERAAHLFASSGDFRQAIEEDARARLLSGEQAEKVIDTRNLQLKAFARGSDQSYWRMELDLSREQPNPPEAYVTPFGLAVIYARLGRKDLALGALEQAFDRRDVQLTEINVEPAFDGLRADTRFLKLLRRMHLN